MEDLCPLKELQSLQRSWKTDVDLGFSTFSLGLPQLLHPCWRMENNHNPILRSCCGSDGISQPSVNVINRDLPGTGAAHSQRNPCRMNLTGMCPVNEEDCAGTEDYKEESKYWRRWDCYLDYAGCFEVIGVCTKDEFVGWLLHNL